MFEPAYEDGHADLSGAPGAGRGAVRRRDPTAKQTYKFGPFSIAPSEEVVGRCVQIDLHNADDLYINTIELDDRPGLPPLELVLRPRALLRRPAEHVRLRRDRDHGRPRRSTAACCSRSRRSSRSRSRRSPKAPRSTSRRTPSCSRRSTCSTRATSTLELSPSISLTPLAKQDVTTVMAAISFENHALGLPPNKQSRFTLDCDLGPLTQQLFDQARPPRPRPTSTSTTRSRTTTVLGTGLTLEAVKPDGTRDARSSRPSNRVGDSLGGPLSIRCST